MRKITLILCLIVAFFAAINVTFAQGVTTASIGGTVKDTKGEGLPGATVVAIHTPSGSKYATATQPDGRFVIQGMRVGGPYTVTTTFIGFKDQVNENVYLSLGTTTNLNVKLSEGDQTLETVEIVSSKGAVISGDRTGAATNIGREQIERMPTISRNFADMTRLTPQVNGNSVGGRSGGANNITIDGALFNNAFGLQSTIGSQAGAQPISLDAIEQIQVSIAPYDVRQGSFTGAGINAVTRSGTNTLSGSAFAYNRTDALQGFKVGATELPKQDLSSWQVGFRLGGPIIKNKLFFFANWETETRSTPSTSFQPNAPGLPPPGTGSNTSAASVQDLEGLKSFLGTNYNYNPQAYGNFPLRNYSDKATAKIDWNISDKHKFSIKYNYLRSYGDIAPSASGGVGARAPSITAMPFFASYYTINNNLNSVIAELNSRFSNEVSNTFQAGFTAMRDFRESPGGIFPMVDIGNGFGQQMTSFGYEPFSANNILDSDVFQISDNLTIYKGKHTITLGTYNEFYRFSNGFSPNYFGLYQFSSLESFYASARAGLAQANGQTPNPQDLIDGVPSRYQLSYAVTPDGKFPFANFTAMQIGLYAQDEIAVRNNLNLTLGLRVDMPYINADIPPNPISDAMTFVDGYKVNISRTQGLTPLWSPRVGFNWDVFNNKKTQLRGGVGVFTGRVPYVWVGNQVANSGNLFNSFNATTAGGGFNGLNSSNYMFSPDVSRHIPVNRAPSSNFNLAFTDPNFKFPQVLRANLGIDQELPFGIIGTIDALYTSDLNAVYLENVNLKQTGTLNTEGDKRPTYFANPSQGTTANGRLNATVSDAIRLLNTDQGYSYNVTFQLQKTFKRNLFTSLSYTYTDARSVNDGGAVAQSQWRDRPVSGSPNATALSFSNFLTQHRVVASVSYRKEYAKRFATSISMFFEAAPSGRTSYAYAGDLNGDASGGAGNDLIFIPRTRADINLVDIQSTTTAGAAPFVYTAAQQWADLDKYISQDEYLSGRRGQYAERNGVENPWFAKADLSIRQDIMFGSGNKKQTVQFSFDVFNFTNLLSSDWGVEKFVIRNNLISYTGLNAAGQPNFTFPYADPSTRTPLTTTFRNSTGLGSRWVAQFGIRYIFN